MADEDIRILRQLHPSVQRAIQLKWRNVHSFHEVQRLAIPVILSGANCLVISSTASGKTEAAFLPVISRIYDAAMEGDGVRVVIIAPLKALLNNLEIRLEEWLLAATSDIKLFKWHGDVSALKKNRQKKNPEAILLTTPESLDVILASSFEGKESYFSNVASVIIDEAHYFANDSRGAQLASSLERMQYLSKNVIQRVGLSATVGDPDSVSQWLQGSGTPCKIIKASGIRKNLAIKHVIIDENNDNYMLELSKTLHNVVVSGKSIIFGNSKKDVEMNARILEGQGIHTMVHHGSISKVLREEAEEEMLSVKDHAVISATSTLELGIDIGDLNKVVQKDTLPSVNSYLQRIGRAGRKDGNANIVLISRRFEDFVLNIAIATLGSEGYSEPLRPSRYRYDILLQQLLLEIYGGHGTCIKSFYQKVCKAYPFQGISFDDCKRLVMLWKEKELFTEDGGILLFGEKIENTFSNKNYMGLYSVFDVCECYSVMYNNEEIGFLENWFAFSLRPEESVFQLAGKKWTVVDVESDLKIVLVRPTKDALPPSWSGGTKVKIEYQVARRFQDILDGSYDVIKHISQEEHSTLLKYQSALSFSSVPEGKIGIKKNGNELWIETYAGTMITDVLGFVICNAFQGIEISCSFFRIELKLGHITEDLILSSISRFIAALPDMTEEYWIAFLKKNIVEYKYSRFSDFIPDDFSVRYASDAYYSLANVRNYANRLGNDYFIRN